MNTEKLTPDDITRITDAETPEIWDRLIVGRMYKYDADSMEGDKGFVDVQMDAVRKGVYVRQFGVSHLKVVNRGKSIGEIDDGLEKLDLEGDVDEIDEDELDWTTLDSLADPYDEDDGGPDIQLDDPEQMTEYHAREALDDIKKLKGEPPYDGGSNYLRGDHLFAESIRRKYGSDDIGEIRRVAEDVLGE